MRPNPAEILQQYPLAVRSVTLISWKEKKGAWSVKTDQGMKVLKKSPAARSRQLFLNQAVRHLRHNGAPIPALVKTRSGSDLAEYQGSVYTLSDAVSGGSPSYDVPGELAEIMKTMGRFHLASRGFRGADPSGERSHLGRWGDSYRRHLDDLRSFKEQARRQTGSFPQLYLKHADTFIRQGETAARVIQGSGYSNWVSKVERQGNLCHQDFAAGNLIRTAKGIYVIDMDSLTLDLPARDLRKIFNKVMKKKGWSADRAVAMLRAYHSVHPLSPDEYHVLKADLLFPHLFYGISSKHFKRRMEAGWSDRKAVDMLTAIVRTESGKVRVLDQWESIVRRITAQRSSRS